MTADLVSTPAHRTLQRIVVWFRLLAFVWMTSLVTATLIDDPGASKPLVVTALSVGFAGTVATVLLSRANRLDRWWWVLVDGAGTLFILLAPGLSQSHDLFYGGYGLSWLLLTVWAFPAILPTDRPTATSRAPTSRAPAGRPPSSEAPPTGLAALRE